MYKTIEAIYERGKVVPLEKIEAKEKSKLLITILDEQKKPTKKWQNLKGKYKGKLLSVDEFIANKRSEKQLEL